MIPESAAPDAYALARSRHHLLFAGLVAGAAGAAILIFVNAWLQREWLEHRWFDLRPGALTWLGVFAAIALLATLSLLACWRRGRWKSTSYAPLRWSLIVLVGAWATLWVFPPPTSTQDGEACLAGAAATWVTGIALLAPRADRPFPRWCRVLDVLACELAACLLLGEVSLRIVRHVAKLPILGTASSGADWWIRTYRLAPGRFRYGFPVNREGFVDIEPEEAARAAHLVVCIGDSFSVSVVPHHLHYTTVAEKAFDDVEVYNAGVVDSGPREYLRILETSALPLHPDLILIALFLGNDLQDAVRGDRTRLSTWLDRDEILVLQLPRRLWAILRERRAGATIADSNWFSETQALTERAAHSIEKVERQMPWLADPFQEQASISPPVFLTMESDRAKFVLRALEPTWDRLFAYLQRIQREARPTPVACILIPDEYQVEDGLWKKVRAKTGLDDSQRDLPQKILCRWFEDHGMAYVDLLPRLRAIPPLGDGDRHLYQFADTHFNARGNRVAGAAVAELIERAGVATRKRKIEDVAPR